MRGLRGFLTGALGLIVLEIVVTNRNATGRVTGLFSGIAKATNWLVDNRTPGIPDRGAASTTALIAPPSSSAPSALLAPPATAPKTPAYAGSVPGTGSLA